jgi:two-component system OmpR family sensor kinase
MTIRTRLTLWYSSLLATLILVFGISLFSILNWVWKSQVQDNMTLIAQQTIDIDPVSGGIVVHIPDGLDLIPYYATWIQVRQADGKLLAASSNLGQYTRPFDPEMLNTHETVARDVYVGKTHAYVLTAPIRGWDGRILGTVQILSSLATIDAATERLFHVMLGVGIVVLLLSFMVGSVITGQGLQPIDAISQAAQQITASGDLSKRVPYDGPPDELGQLTATFNATLERLERLFTAQKRFVADMSHELRTPLTTVQGNLDLIKRMGYDPTSIEVMDSEIKRMSRLVGDLLLLAQADSGRLPLTEAPVELGTLVLEVFRQAKVLAKEVDLRLGTIDAVYVKGDADRLKQLVLNIVTNAIKYTPAGGQVVITVGQSGNKALIKVKDTGIGIPKEDLEHIFDRFYRVDKARSRRMGGTGLGLSIARWIVDAHHGRIWAESEVGQGSTFTVQLPCLEVEGTPDSMRATRPRLSTILRRARAGQNNVKKAPQKTETPPVSTANTASSTPEGTDDATTGRNSTTYEQALASPRDHAADRDDPGVRRDSDPGTAD